MCDCDRYVAPFRVMEEWIGAALNSAFSFNAVVLTNFVVSLKWLSSLIRWGRGQQLTTVATGKNGAAGWRGEPGCWPSSPSPPSPQRPRWRCVRGGGAHVHHEWVRRSHGALAWRRGVRRQLRFTFARLLDGDLARLQPKTQETGEEDVRLYLWTQRGFNIRYAAMKTQQSDRKTVVKHIGLFPAAEIMADADELNLWKKVVFFLSFLFVKVYSLSR